MKKMIIFLIVLACSTQAMAQSTVAHTSQIIKKEVNGAELMYDGNELFTGYVVESHEDGKPKLWMTVKEGRANGKWQEWYKNGQLKFDASWKEGKGHGLWLYFHENGTIRQEEFYDMDIPVGIFRDYYPNGQVKLQSAWMNGLKEGVWTTYSEDGSVIKTESYSQGELLATEKE